eukprot:Platyproteum_vivax@DN4316_c0_g1_i1.p1
MRILRQNKDSVMAMLDVFVHDPLINWRLLPLLPNNAQAPSSILPYRLRQKYHKTRPKTRTLNMTINEGTLGEADRNGIRHWKFEPVQSQSAAPLEWWSTRKPKKKVLKSISIVSSLNSSPRRDDSPLHPFDPMLADDSIVTSHQRGVHQRQLTLQVGPQGERAKPEELSATARRVLQRVVAKLKGEDFLGARVDVATQVDRLINEATSHENLCQCYVGWCPFW